MIEKLEDQPSPLGGGFRNAPEAQWAYQKFDTVRTAEEFIIGVQNEKS